MSKESAELHINFSVIQDNICYLKTNISDHTNFLSVIKANAYGHELEEFVSRLNDLTDGFAVVRLDEAMKIRKISNKPILLMQGVYQQNEIDQVIEHNLMTVLHTHEQINLYKDIQSKTKIWIKFNTGMNRLGFQMSEADQIQSFINDQNVLMTHLASSDVPSDPSNQKQMSKFQDLYDSFSTKPERSILNSSGVINFPSHAYDWVRCGIGLYGGVSGVSELKTAVTFKSKIISINKIKKGDAVGYGGRIRAKQDMSIAVVYCGYADGFPQSALDGTSVRINDKEAKMFGRVSMDLITIDITHLNDVKFGDWVEFWSPQHSINKFADYNKLISYELMTRIDRRVRRVIYEN